MSLWEIARARVGDYSAPVEALGRILLYAGAFLLSVWLGAAVLPGVPGAAAGFFLVCSTGIELGRFLALSGGWPTWRDRLYAFCLAGLMAALLALLFGAGRYCEGAAQAGGPAGGPAGSPPPRVAP